MSFLASVPSALHYPFQRDGLGTLLGMVLLVAVGAVCASFIPFIGFLVLIALMGISFSYFGMVVEHTAAGGDSLPVFGDADVQGWLGKGIKSILATTVPLLPALIGSAAGAPGVLTMVLFLLGLYLLPGMLMVTALDRSWWSAFNLRAVLQLAVQVPAGYALLVVASALPLLVWWFLAAMPFGLGHAFGLLCLVVVGRLSGLFVRHHDLSSG